MAKKHSKGKRRKLVKNNKSTNIQYTDFVNDFVNDILIILIILIIITGLYLAYTYLFPSLRNNKSPKISKILDKDKDNNKCETIIQFGENNENTCLCNNKRCKCGTVTGSTPCVDQYKGKLPKLIYTSRFTGGHP